MKYTKLGKTSIKISQMGLGTRILDSMKRNSQLSFQELISYAIKNGINFFVGAGHYSSGSSEKMLGKALNKYRKKIFLATSSGVVHTKDNISINLSVPLIKEQLEQSLKNLQTDYIDLFQLHYFDPTCDLKPLYTYLQELYDSQIIHSLGVSNFRLQELQDWEGLPISSVQMPYNPLQREIENEYSEYCTKNNISILGYTPLSGGIFTNKQIKNKDLSPYNEFLANYKLDKINSFLVDLSKFASHIGLSVSQVVLIWLREKSFLSSILLGTTNIQHLTENINALNRLMSSSDLININGLMDSFWNNFPDGITIPLSINNKIEIINGQRYTKIFGNYIPLPDYVKLGDTVQINDSLGKII